MADREQVTIAGVVFTLNAPYDEGHECTPGEASQLNQVRHENIRNNFAKRVAKAVEEAGSATLVNVEAIQTELDQYDAGYSMGIRSRGTGVSRTTDPVLREARSIAKDALANALRAKGRKISDLAPELLKTKIDEILSRHPEFTEKARERVAEKQALAASTLDEDIGDVPEAPAVPEAVAA